jgi:uncharacterized protein YjbK
MLQWDAKLIETICTNHNLIGLKCLGGFKTLRKLYREVKELQNETVELDETVYSFGMKFEIEIETSKPEILKPQLCQLLNRLNVQYQDSKRTKLEDLLRESLT